MFRRTFWFTAGAAAGVWATTKVTRQLRRLTPDSLAAQAASKAIDAGHRLKDFALDVRDGMAQREAELGEALGLKDPGRGQAIHAAPHRPALAAREPAERLRGDVPRTTDRTAHAPDRTTGKEDH